MTVAVIVLAIALAGSAAGLVLFARWFKAANDERLIAMRLYQDTRDLSGRYMDERDDALAKLAGAELSRKALTMRIEQLERERNAAYDRGVEAVRARLASSSAADAVAVVDRLLFTPLPNLSAAASAGAGSDGGGHQDPVQPAHAAGADDAGRGGAG